MEPQKSTRTLVYCTRTLVYCLDCWTVYAIPSTCIVMSDSCMTIGEIFCVGCREVHDHYHVVFARSPTMTKTRREIIRLKEDEDQDTEDM